MPIYEYLCEACGAHVDILQKMDAPAPSSCKNCGAQNMLKKRISMSAFHLKGGGWYSELYASKTNADSAATQPPAPPNGAPTGNKSPTEAAPSPCAGCPAASNAACANAQKP